MPSKEKARESFDKVVAFLEKEFEYNSPPFQRALLTYLFAKLEGWEPPAEIAELLKSNSYREHIEYEENKFNQVVGKAPKDVQECIIAALLERLEPKEKEYEAECARDEAVDKVLDAISDWTTEEILYLAERLKEGLGIAIKKVVEDREIPQTKALEDVKVPA